MKKEGGSMPIEQQNPKNPKKSLLYYYCIVLILVLLLNALVFPFLGGQKVEEVGYNTFLDQVEAGQVTQVEIQENQIAYLTRDTG